ncbi:putative protein N(5)-glutamine methyltransferase [Herbiconiux daphne]|uniref:peptide chain release factor N(5)-glutamine methyltransferase n=1 Tax=Herbiconiux daphne TaxID=2970914 RepID=A0ABT2H4D0_9MICO|nr:putative protein N(5)-glutamine methyltransferase [Herbiconiux daphne]MCS5734796.1 putative protein N(5)-glutamine methyltransferase [Herbiconiux daphne]
MSEIEDFPAVDAVVARLRAAGCVFAEDEAAVLFASAATPAALESMVTRRVEGLPLEHIVGWTEFAGQRIAVDPGVFVPRRRTEFLVQNALELARPGAVVLDLCCGSGAVGAALAAASVGLWPDEPLDVYAADIDPAAVRSARRNIPSPGHVFEGDLYDALPASLRGRVDILVVNAPYVPTEAIATMPPEARLHEARVALDGGGDGLDVQRRVTTDAATWLSPDGHLLIETSEHQAPLTAALFAAAGLLPRIEHSDDLDGTVVVGSRD